VLTERRQSNPVEAFPRPLTSERLILLHRRAPRKRTPSTGLAGACLLRAIAVVALVAGGAGRAEAQIDDRVIRGLTFEGNNSIPAPVLEASIATTKSGWFARNGLVRWLGLGEKRYFDEVEFQRDVFRLAVLYKRSGFPDVQVDTLVRRDPENVWITFLIEEGAPILVDTLIVTGLDSVPGWVRNRADLDLPLQQGDVFDRALMQADADSITRRLRDRGYPSADVLVSYAVRTAERRATVTLDANPGVRARIGDVRVEGVERVDSSTVVDLMTARPGELYSQTDLFQSQRNLYNADLFRIATVDIDSARFEPGTDSVPLRVRVGESPPRRLRIGAGYGTNDCLRTNAGLTLRNFLGNGRLVDLSGSVSKVGIGDPLDWGLENSICKPLRDDSIGSRLLNYNLTTAVRRPAFLSANNTLIVSAFVERRSEFKVYRREEVGMSVGITRETPTRRLPLALTYTLAYGNTEATPVSFCAFFNACIPADVDLLSRQRRLATITATGSIPRANNPLDPTRGSVASAELTWASRWIGSSRLLQFARVIGDYAWYRPLARDVVLSWRIRGGVIFSPRVALTSDTAAYVPPEQRFYGGGPSDVRGYQRNELGPVVYVIPRADYDAGVAAGETEFESARDSNRIRVAATGGNSLAVGNVEVRFPSPVFGQRLRLAAFVDVGSVWERGQAQAGPRFRVTPGAGLRVSTPLGPARFDVAYSPAALAPGQLYIAEPDDRLTPDPARTGFQLDRGRRWTIHFAVGQPF